MNISLTPTILDIHTLYRQGSSVKEVTSFFLERIESLNPTIGAFVKVHAAFALNQATFLDSLLSSADLDTILVDKPLFGIPFALKDNILVESLPAQSASKILEGFIAPYSSDVYELLHEAGGVMLGQTNMDEFAFGSSTEYSSYDTVTKNPYDLSRVPGGTSGGSAAAVAAGMIVFAIGTDTGGSVRQPASFCGVVGVRPTYGLISRYGIMASASSFDQPGVFSQDLLENQHILKILGVGSKRDDTALSVKNNNLVPNKILKIGLPAEFFGDALDPKIRALIDDKLTQFTHIHNAQFVPVSLPSTDYNVAAYYILMAVEASSNLERYDGVRFGNTQPGELFFATRGALFGDEVQRRILLGTFASSAGYYDAYYNTAVKMRNQIKAEFTAAFEIVDVIITPTSPFVAFGFGEKSASDPLAMYLADIMTLAPALAQNASISIPIGTIRDRDSDLPVGLQIIAPAQHEQILYHTATLLNS